MNDVMPGSDGPENLKILKKSQWGVDCGPCKQTIELLPLGQRMEFSAIQLSSDHGVEKLRFDHGVEKLGPDHGVEKLRLDHEMYRTLGVLLASYDYERLLRIVSFSSCRRTEIRSL